MESEQVFKKILFLTDGSDPSLSAQELTISLARKLGSEVTVFHVVTHELMRTAYKDFLVQSRGVPESADIRPAAEIRSEISLEQQTPTSAGAHYSERIQDELTSIYHQQAEDIVADAAQVFKEEGIQVDKKIVQHKHVAEAVLREAEREDYAVIIMGRSGHKEKDARLGSVAEKVSRHSLIPVLIAGEKRTISKVLVPLDGSKSSQKALECAASLSKKLGAEMTLLHVQESHLFGVRPEVAKMIGKGILADAAEKVKGLSFDQKLESGDPARTISKVAAKEDFDVVVMGCTGHSGIDRFLLGSVTDYVLHYATQPVLIVR